MTELYTDKQIANGRRKLYRAEAWRKANPEAWGYAVRIATEQARQGQPVSARELVDAVRRKAFTDREGRDARPNNDYAPIWGRWIAIEHPETAPYIEHRKTVFDWLVA